MTQNPYTFKHSPEGLKIVSRETDEAEGQGNSYQRPPRNQQTNRQRAYDPRNQQPVRKTRTGTRQPTSYGEDDIEDEVWPTLSPRSAIRYAVDTNGQPIPGVYKQGNITHRYHGDLPQGKRNAIPSRRSAQTQNQRAPQQQYLMYEEDEEIETARPLRARPKIQLHWLVFVSIALLLMIAGWIGFNDLSGWWQNHQDDVTYGMPRTYQIDAVVGHNDSNSNPSHFIAINLRGSIYIIEAPAGNFSKSRSYFITSEVGGDPNPPVTVKFQDLTHSGRLDMVVSVGDPPTPLIVFLFNNGSQFIAKSQ